MSTTYEPALCMRLRKPRSWVRLYVILAADGTPLDTMEETDDTLPRWVTGLVQLPIVDVSASTYQEFKQSMSAITI